MRQAKADIAVQNANNQRESRELSASPKVMRVPVPVG